MATIKQCMTQLYYMVIARMLLNIVLSEKQYGCNFPNWNSEQQPMQSVPITTNVVSSNPAHGEVYLIQHYVMKFVSDLLQVGSFLRVLRFPPPIKLTTTI
jgi:hypothetical protein